MTVPIDPETPDEIAASLGGGPPDAVPSEAWHWHECVRCRGGWSCTQAACLEGLEALPGPRAALRLPGVSIGGPVAAREAAARPC